jgi:hypothetical protein
MTRRRGLGEQLPHFHTVGLELNLLRVEVFLPAIDEDESRRGHPFSPDRATAHFGR